MVSRFVLATAATMMLSVVGCDYGLKAKNAASLERPGEFVWQVPEGFPIPTVPADNPMTWAKVELGRQLFYDSRISGDGSVSCASCHQPDLAFTDGRDRAVGIHGNIHSRSAMSLTNVAYNATLGWDDPTLTRLEDQILIPLNNMQPPEMGAAGREAEIVTRLKKDLRLRRLFDCAFPHDKSPVTMRNVIYALASFERTLISGNSPYDRWAYGAEPDALDKDQRAGARLFFSKRLNCFRCHAGFNLSGPVKYAGSKLPEARFHNTALYNEDGTGAYPKPNTGLHRLTGQPDDMGKFRAPTLRNIALTAPYMHDGSIPTLEKVLDHYAAGGRSHNNSQIMHRGFNTDPLMTGFELTPLEKRQLIAFLQALTDQTFIQQALEQAIRKQ
jgi:cytochrome c peroxidase